MKIYSKSPPNDKHLRWGKLKKIQILNSSFYSSCDFWVYFMTLKGRVNGNNSVDLIFVPLRLSHDPEHILCWEKISRVANVLNRLKWYIFFFFNLSVRNWYRPILWILTMSFRTKYKCDRAQKILHNQCAILNNSKKMENQS